jgi:hypothetical protein
MRNFFVLSSMLSVTLFGLAGCQKATVEGKDGIKLTIMKPTDTSITRGSTDPVKVSISREKFKDPVEVTFSGLPDGVHVQDPSKKITQDESAETYTLKADNDAKLVENQVVTVTAKGPDQVAASEKFKLTVKDKK